VLEKSIDDLIQRQNAVNLSTSTHVVTVPKWARGEESAEMILPRRQKLTILGLGGSSNTPDEGITAQVLVVDDFDDLAAKKDKVSHPKQLWTSNG